MMLACQGRAALRVYNYALMPGGGGATAADSEWRQQALAAVAAADNVQHQVLHSQPACTWLQVPSPDNLGCVDMN